MLHLRKQAQAQGVQLAEVERVLAGWLCVDRIYRVAVYKQRRQSSESCVRCV